MAKATIKLKTNNLILRSFGWYILFLIYTCSFGSTAVYPSVGRMMHGKRWPDRIVHHHELALSRQEHVDLYRIGLQSP
jgi:hypothetical protein